MFLSKDHYNNYFDLLSKDNTKDSDYERKSMFFIFAGNSETIKKIDALYDFENRTIHPDFENRADFSSGFKGLVRLAFNLYNGYKDDHSNVRDIFYNLDAPNMKLAIESIKVRYSDFLEY